MLGGVLSTKPSIKNPEIGIRFHQVEKNNDVPSPNLKGLKDTDVLSDYRLKKLTH